jgi:hypothetical protein
MSDLMDVNVIDIFLKVTILLVIGIILYRSNTKEGWYLRVFSQWINNKRSIDIPEEAIHFNRVFQNDEYLNTYLRNASYAVLWLCVTWLIDLMAVVGGSTIVDKEPIFKIPCMLLISIMNIICIYKVVLVYAGIIEDWGFKLIAIVILGRLTVDEPMRLRVSRKEPRSRKDPIFINDELLNKEEAPKNV